MGKEKSFQLLKEDHGVLIELKMSAVKTTDILWPYPSADIETCKNRIRIYLGQIRVLTNWLPVHSLFAFPIRTQNGLKILAIKVFADLSAIFLRN